MQRRMLEITLFLAVLGLVAQWGTARRSNDTPRRSAAPCAPLSSPTTDAASTRCTVSQAAGPVPGDFEIRAYYVQAYFSDWLPVTTVVQGDGQSVQTARSKGGDLRKRLQLSAPQIHHLESKIRETDFFSLYDEYGSQLADCDNQKLEITIHGKVHTVIIDGAAFCIPQSHVARFEKVWAELLTLVPSPNREDRPEHWLHLFSTPGNSPLR